MMTKDEALRADNFHYGDCSVKIERWRRNGKNKLWKTRPNDFHIPIKHGLRWYSYINQDTIRWYHVAEK